MPDHSPTITGRQTSRNREFPLPFIIIGALVLTIVVGGFESYLLMHEWRARDARARFVEVAAVVLESRLELADFGEESAYRPFVEYRYRYEGDEFTANRYSFISWHSSTLQDVMKVVDRHPAGSDVTVYIDPDDPQSAVLKLHDGPFPMFLVLFLAPFHCFWFFMIGLLVRALRRRGKTDEELLRYRFVVRDRPDHLVMRRPRAAAWKVFLVLFGSFTLLAIFPVAGTQGMTGGGPFALPVIGTGFVFAGFITAWKIRRDRRPSEFLHVDRRLGVFSYPADQEGQRIDAIDSLELHSRETGVIIDSTPQLDHTITALLAGAEVDVFAFRGGLLEGEPVRALVGEALGVSG